MRTSLLCGGHNLDEVGKGKSLSEALIFASTNPQYDDRLFIELLTCLVQENYKFSTNMLCTKIVFCFCLDIQDNLCTHVLRL